MNLAEVLPTASRAFLTAEDLRACPYTGIGVRSSAARLFQLVTTQVPGRSLMKNSATSARRIARGESKRGVESFDRAVGTSCFLLTQSRGEEDADEAVRLARLALDISEGLEPKGRGLQCVALAYLADAHRRRGSLADAEWFAWLASQSRTGAAWGLQGLVESLYCLLLAELFPNLPVAEIRMDIAVWKLRSIDSTASVEARVWLTDILISLDQSERARHSLLSALRELDHFANPTLALAALERLAAFLEPETASQLFHRIGVIQRRRKLSSLRVQPW